MIEKMIFIASGLKQDYAQLNKYVLYKNTNVAAEHVNSLQILDMTSSC